MKFTCKGPAVRGKQRCRMHGGTNPGRPRDPSVQRLKYYRMVRVHVTKMCADCILINLNCSKIHGGKNIPENFERRINEYCRASPFQLISAETFSSMPSS